MLAELDRARRSLRIAEDRVPREMRLRGKTTQRVRKERRNVWALEQQILRLERGARSYEEGPEEPPAEASAQGETKKQAKARRRAERRRKLAPRRRVVAGIAREIQAAFSAGDAHAAEAGTDAPAGAGRLPWSVLPPGELTLERVLAHYRRLVRERPDARFEPERIKKAFSLGPQRWWEGRDGFGGYVVFEYPGTDRVLLECGLYGHAIYVLGPNWKRLSRQSKREVLKDPSSSRIIHAGAWFAKTKAVLGLR
jgi:hypothetical protein